MTSLVTVALAATAGLVIVVVWPATGLETRAAVTALASLASAALGALAAHLAHERTDQ